jgi:hypothetical protein
MMILSCGSPNRSNIISYPQVLTKSIQVGDISRRTFNDTTHLSQSELPAELDYLVHYADYLPDTIILISDTICSFRFQSDEAHKSLLDSFNRSTFYDRITIDSIKFRINYILFDQSSGTRTDTLPNPDSIIMVNNLENNNIGFSEYPFFRIQYYCSSHQGLCIPYGSHGCTRSLDSLMSIYTMSNDTITICPLSIKYTIQSLK